MCGIVGVTGATDTLPRLIDGLKRLEYRGYDSAGLSYFDGEIFTIKAVGKVVNLENKLKELKADNSKSICGIAHTRWATHGVPSEVNAHPHFDTIKNFSVVHNGIIENYLGLKKQLQSKGYVFISETDSEVIAHLIADLYDGDLLQTVIKALKQITGTFGIAVMSKFEPNKIIVARQGSPIVLGLGETFNMVASDISALAAYTKNVIYLNDGDLAILTPTDVALMNYDKSPIEREVSTITYDVERASKNGYDHYMLKEIFEQPEALQNTLRGRINYQLATANLSGLNLNPHDLSLISRICIAACGSSLHAGMIGKYYFEDIATIPVDVEQAAEFRYRNPILASNTLVIPISQSGETADTLAAVREAMNKGAIVAAISNVVGSTIAREATRGIYLHAGPEISVASTKGFSTQILALLLMGLMFGRNRRLSSEEGQKIIQDIESIVPLIHEVLKQSANIEAIAKKYASKRDFFFIGRGVLHPVALEGALKLKEISYVHAEGYHAAELKHGPIALLDEDVPVIALANNIPGKDKMIGNIQECIARKAPVIAIINDNDAEISKLKCDIISIPDSSRLISPFTTVVALQLFAYYFAKHRGCEIDQPRNLAKSVTVE